MSDDQLHSDVHNDAERIVDYLRTIRSMLKRVEDMNLVPIDLTSAQISVLRELITTDGLSLKELSNRLGLAHSTVSGVVDRLEQRNLLHRRTDPTDKRFNRIYLDEKVTSYVNHTFYSHRSTLLAEAIKDIPDQERQQIVASFEKIYNVLKAKFEHDTKNQIG